MPQYQGVWTLEQQAQAQSNQQWVTDPNFKNTTLLLQADGTGSGSQNQTFLDGSTNNFFITRNGNTTQGSFSPFSQAPGYWGNYFNGSSDYLVSNSSTALNLGANDFTAECWFYTTSTASTQTIISGVNATLGTGSWLLQINNTGQLRFYCNYNGGTALDYNVGTGTVSTNTWNHFAVTRNGANLRIFLNGTQVGTTNTTLAALSIDNASGNYTIGQVVEIRAGWYFAGYISNLRVVIGTALYTSTFTPSTTPLTAVTNTKLLTSQSNRFLDNSTNALTFTTGGTPSVQAFAPFAPALQWTPDVVGGSGYFDGTGDYLQTPDNAALDLSGDFTVEAWVYVPNVSGEKVVFHNHTSDNNGIAFVVNGASIRIGSGSGPFWNVLLDSSNTITANSWNHIAGTRSGNTYTVWVNGVSGGTATSSVTPTYSGGAQIGRFTSGLPLAFSSYMASFRVVKGTAVYTANFTPSTTPLTAITNTSLLLNYTNAGIYDGKMGNVLETVGNAQVATSPVKYGSGSMYFDGANDYLLSPPGPNYNLGNGDFTIELWAYDISRSSSGTVWLCKWGNAASVGRSYILGYITSSSTLTFDMSSDGTSTTASLSTTTSGIRTGVWNHIAVSRNGNLFRLFLNGNIVATLVNSITLYTQTTLPFCIATNYEDKQSSLSTWDVNGFIDDLRITKGVCRYTANFTPPQQALPRQ